MNEAARERQRQRCRNNRKKNKNYNDYKQSTRAQLRTTISNIKESQPCSDCGFFYPPQIMEFDHRPGEKKVSTISAMVVAQAAWYKIVAEMSKCDLVCANCHRYRTFISRVKKLKPSKKPPKGLSL